MQWIIRIEAACTKVHVKRKAEEACDNWSRESAKPLQGKLGGAQRYTLGKTPLEGAEGSLGTL